MSLLRLLTAGKSLVGLKSPQGRYHLPGEKSLPNFGPKKNPFRATAFPEKAVPESQAAKPVDQVCDNGGAASEESALAASGATAFSDGESLPRTAALASPSAGAKETKQDIKPVSSTTARPSGLRALFLWRRVKKPRLLSGSIGSRPMVQQELSLDTVKVVRNDLSESDLEVIQCEPVSNRTTSGKLGAIGKMAPPESVFGPESSGQLLSVGKS